MQVSKLRQDLDATVMDYFRKDGCRQGIDKLKEKVLAHEKEKAKAKAAAAITWAEALDVSGKFLVCECDVEGDVKALDAAMKVVNPKPQIPNPKPQIPSPKPPKPQTPNPRPKLQTLNSGGQHQGARAACVFPFQVVCRRQGRLLGCRPRGRRGARCQGLDQHSARKVRRQGWW